MRLRNIKGANKIIEESKYIILDPETKKNNWKEVFKNNNPIHIEIGMGKGDFIIGMAKKYKDINFIVDIDKKSKYYGTYEHWETILDNLLGNFMRYAKTTIKIISNIFTLPLIICFHYIKALLTSQTILCFFKIKI